MANWLDRAQQGRYCARTLTLPFVIKPLDGHLDKLNAFRSRSKDRQEVSDAAFVTPEQHVQLR
jgi:hypothetical protein